MLSWLLQSQCILPTHLRQPQWLDIRAFPLTYLEHNGMKVQLEGVLRRMTSLHYLSLCLASDFLPFFGTSCFFHVFLFWYFFFLFHVSSFFTSCFTSMSTSFGTSVFLFGTSCFSSSFFSFGTSCFCSLFSFFIYCFFSMSYSFGTSCFSSFFYSMSSEVSFQLSFFVSIA